MANDEDTGGARAPDEPASGRVRMVNLKGDQLTFLTPPEDQDRSGGVGGWNETARPLHRPSHWWGGTPNDTLTLPLMIDLAEQTGTVEGRLATLYERFGRPVGDDDEPPGIMLLGDVLERDKRITWKLDEVSIGAKRFDPAHVHKLLGVRLSLSLSRLTTAAEIERVTVRRTRGPKGGKRRQRTIRTQKGETLRGLAVRYLGSSSEWTSIRKWNPKLKRTDPDARLRGGLKVLLK